MKNLKIWFWIAAVGTFILCSFWFDHYVWRKQHPTAPAWTYFFK